MEPPKSRRPAVKAAATIAIIIIVALLLLTPAVQGFLRDLIASPFQPRYPESATFSFQRVLTIDANGASVGDYAFDISVPGNMTINGVLVQDVQSVTYSPAVTWQGEKYDQGWVTWEGTGVPSHSTRTFTTTYTVAVHTQLWSIDKGSSLSVNEIPQALKAKYLVNEWSEGGTYKIDMSSQLIKAQAKAIVGNETNVYQILKDIYDWMIENVNYPTLTTTSSGPQSAQTTLSMMVGDCDDQSILFCSLARALGVPAWLQLGALYVDSESTWGGHAWLQTYIPTSGGGEYVTIDVVNKDFLVFRPDHFTDYTDDGNGEHLADYYQTSAAASSGLSEPVLSDKYVSISYEESEKKVSQGTVYDIEVPMLAGTAPATSRR